MQKYSINAQKLRQSVRLVATLFVLLTVLLPNVTGNIYFSLLAGPCATVNSPPVVLQAGTAGTSTIYTNGTSAKVSVEAPLFDYVDDNDCDVDSSADKGMHSNFTGQQHGPDSIYDALTEENTEAIEDYVDSNTSDVDNSPDVGTHSNFENEKLKNGIYDTLTEAVEKIIRDGATQGQSTSATVIFSHTLGYSSGNNRLVVVAAGFENDLGDVNIGGATYNGQGMTKVVQATTGGAGYVASVALFYLLDSSLPSSSGSYSVVITADSDPFRDLWACAVSYIGVKQEAPDDYDSDSSGSPTTMTSNLICDEGGSMLVQACVVGNTGSFTPSSGTTEVIEDSDIDSAAAVFNEKLDQDSGARDLGCTHSNMNRGSWVGACWAPASTDYELDIEVQFTSVIDFLPTEKLCIYTGALSSEDLRVDYWNGTGWENLATNLNAYSCNEYTVSLTSTTFTIRFKDGTAGGDTAQDQWQIDASLLRVEDAGSKEDAVDNDTSDVDSSADLGNLVNFDNMKATDSTYASLTESTGGITYINRAEASATTGTSAQINKPTGTAQDDFMIALLVSTIASDTDGSTMSSAPSGWTNEYDYIQSATSGQHVYIYWKVAGASEPSSYTWTWTSSCGWVAQITTFRGVDTTSPIHVEGTVNQESSSSPMSPSITTTVDNCMIWLYDMCDDDDVPASGGAPSGTTWIDQTEIASPGDGIGISTAYFVQASAGATGNKDWTLDAIEENSGQQYALKPVPPNYQLDQEVQWTDTLYTLPNEELCIYGGTMGAEDIRVDVWNGTGWENVFNDLSNGWNNQSITDWLTSSTITIRFKGGTETGDTNQDAWQIDVALIHVWHDGGESYEFDVEVQWTNTDYTRLNEELCIRTGTFSGSESIQVRAWNTTGSSWHWVMNLTANQWNNVSITPYLTSSTFTVQFLGETETGDTAEDSWNIDATLLHVWTDDATFNYVLRVNNTKTDSWQIRLKKYSDSNINRLQNCTIYFHNSSDGTSRQIYIEDGSYTNQTGPWYDLGDSETIYIAMTVEATSTGTSYVRTYLEILIPDKTTYAQYVLTFEFT